MPSALDIRMDQIMAQLTAEGGMIPVTTYEQNGLKLPMIK